MKKHILNKKIMAGAITLVLFQSYSYAESLTAVFPMYDPTNVVINTDTTVLGSIDLSAINSGSIVDGTTPWAVSSSQLFFGINWLAYNGVLYGPGTHSLSLVDAAPCPTGAYPICATSATPESITVGANQVAGHIKFAWGATGGIDVIDLWNISYSRTGVATFTNTDLDSDAAPGWGMKDGPFIGFEAVFNLTVQPAFTTTMEVTQPSCGASAVTTVNTGAGNVTISSGVTAPSPTFSWTASASNPSAITPIGGTSSTNLEFSPAGLSAGTYRFTLLTTSSGNTVRSEHSFNIVASSLSALDDSDGDGIDDVTDSVCDVNGNGIADYLDNSNVPANSLQMSISAHSLGGVMTSSSGTLSPGAIADTKYNNELPTFIATGIGNGFGPIVEITDLATDATQSSCVGGCFDFAVSGVTPGSSVQIVIPLSAAIPQNPVYRKYDSIDGWSGFELDAGNSIASAAALSSGPITCPAPGNAAYTSGLTPGHYCVQLTIQDNGPNDSDTTDGSIADPGGVASTNQFNPKNSGEVDGVGGGWWLLMGFPALFGLRRITKK